MQVKLINSKNIKNQSNDDTDVLHITILSHLTGLMQSKIEVQNICILVIHVVISWRKIANVVSTTDANLNGLFLIIGK